MKKILQFVLIIVATFVVLTVFSGDVHAEEIPMSEKQQLIEQQAEVIEQKTTLLVTTSEEIASLEDRKLTLLQQLENESKTVEELKKKVEEKREAAEREKKRLEELRNMFVRVDRYSGDSSGNTYTPGNCTWYAKSRRADIPNSLGNANTWYSRAASLGWNVGLTPKKGAVATSTAGWAGHVAYVEGVSLDGIWVTISEMNYSGLYSMNTRTVHYTEFQYIYELN